MTECSRRRRRRQMVDTKELPQRARYYQSVGDGIALSKGGHYTGLKEQYIIFLCPMDIFGRGFPAYHFENRAREDFNITLNDLSYKNYYIFTRYKDFTDPVVKAYMKYFATRNVDSRETENINNQVSYYKADTLIRNKYMTFEYDLHESKEEGRAEGRVEERREIAAAMLADGDSVEKVVRISKLTEAEVLAIKANLAN